MSFRIRGLSAEPFADLFALSDEELKTRGAVRQIADSNYPCRVSLTDAQPGDELLLVNYEHHPVGSPYRMRFAIFVRHGEEQYDAVDQMPEQLRGRMLAVRAFDADGMMVARNCRRPAGGTGDRAHVRESCGGVPARPFRLARLLRRAGGPHLMQDLLSGLPVVAPSSRSATARSCCGFVSTAPANCYAKWS